MDNLWVQLAVIVGIQFALAVIALMVNGLHERLAKEKLMPQLAIEFGVSTLDVEEIAEEKPEKFLQYMMAWASHDKWENRFANLVGSLLKPFVFIAKIAGWLFWIIPLSVLVGESTFAQGLEYAWMYTGGLVAWTFLVLAIDSVTYAITGRRAGAPAEAVKMFTAEWNMQMSRKKWDEDSDWLYAAQ